MSARRADVFVNRNERPATWPARHRAGETPEELPYGFEQLASRGWSLTFPPPLIGPARRAVNGIGRRIDGLPWGWGVQPPARRREPTLCWDERSSVPLVTLGRARVISGVIWIPDRPATAVQLRALRRLRAGWALSRPQVEALRAQGVAGGRVEHLLFGVATSHYTPGASFEDGTAEAPKAALEVLCVGNDVDRDYDILVEALAGLRAEGDVHPRLTLVTNRRVRMPDGLGRQMERVDATELRTLYRMADVAVVPCRDNLHCSGMTSALEAMSCGTPVVATRTPGMEDYVDDGRTGLLYRTGDSVDLARCVGLMAADGALRRRLSCEGRRVAVARFDSSRMAADIDALATAAFAEDAG